MNENIYYEIDNTVILIFIYYYMCDGSEQPIKMRVTYNS